MIGFVQSDQHCNPLTLELVLTRQQLPHQNHYSGY